MSVRDIYEEDGDDLFDSEDCVLRSGGFLFIGNLFSEEAAKSEHLLPIIYKSLYEDLKVSEIINLDDLADAALADTDLLIDTDRSNINVHFDLGKYEGKYGTEVEDETFSLKGISVKVLDQAQEVVDISY